MPVEQTKQKGNINTAPNKDKALENKPTPAANSAGPTQASVTAKPASIRPSAATGKPANETQLAGRASSSNARPSLGKSKPVPPSKAAESGRSKPANASVTTNKAAGNNLGEASKKDVTQVSSGEKIHVAASEIKSHGEVKEAPGEEGGAIGGCYDMAAITLALTQSEMEDEGNKYIRFLPDLASLKCVLKEAGTKPVIVDMYAPWCGYCIRMERKFQELSEKYKDDVFSCKINVDVAHDVIDEYLVLMVPTILVFVDQKQVYKKSDSSPEHITEVFTRFSGRVSSKTDQQPPTTDSPPSGL